MANDLEKEDFSHSIQHHDTIPADPEKAPIGDPEDDSEVTLKTKLAVLSLIFMYESYLFTLVMPATVLTYIDADLGPDARYPWIAITWNLGAAVIVSVGGRLSDIAGRRWFLMFGAVSAAAGALIGATGQSITQMIVSGIVFGIGGGFQEMCFACAQELVPNKFRFQTLGEYPLSPLFNATKTHEMAGIMILANHFSSFSPLIGYVFIAHTKIGWRACYWWCFAWEVVTALMLFFFYHPPTFETKHRGDGKTKWQLVKEIDYIGLILFTAGCLLLLLALNWGNGIHPWSSPWIIAPVVVSVVSFVFLGFWEVYAPLAYPMLPPHLFREWRRFTAFLVVCFVAGMLYYSLNVIWPRQSGLLWVPADRPIIRGVYASMVSFGTIIAGWYCVSLMPWLKHEKWQLVACITIQTALIGSLASVGLADKAQAIATVISVSSVNLPPSPLSFGMVSLHLKDQTDIGIGVGLISTFRLIGGAVATAIYTSIQTSEFAKLLPGQVRAAAERTGFDGSVEALVAAARANTPAAYGVIEGITNSTIAAVQHAVLESNSKSYRLVYLVAIAFGCVAIAAALSVKSIDGSQRSNQVAAKLENDGFEHVVKGGDESVKE
ncbi:fungal trichothecene efflux pump [Dactylonectria estremocensis]|uniref:Fungal trichothecene efflux pump n=1 Tax=Dactylonectria estremocensis TaxID=1079267 RepID=A0A9P9FHA1_9HYPO|nr:fungal trichothecene efflux pump [Dactylonectria estremocensis]